MPVVAASPWRRISPTYATGVLGYTVAEAARTIGADGHAAYRSLDQARASLRDWGEDRSDVTPPRSEAAQRLPSQRPHPSPNVAMSRPPKDDHLQPISGPMAPLLVTPLQAAGLLGISRSKLYALIKAGEIPSVTIGATRRIPHRDLVDYVERRREADRRRHSRADPASDRAAPGAPGNRRAATDPEVDDRDRLPRTALQGAPVDHQERLPPPRMARQKSAGVSDG
jgi:excisionase family DNA binding protein